MYLPADEDSRATTVEGRQSRPFALPLTVASAVFFSVWVGIPVATVIPSFAVLLIALSLVSLAGAALFLLEVRSTSNRWPAGIPLAAVAALLAAWNMVAGPAGLNPGPVNVVLLLLLAPAAALAIYALPMRCRGAVRPLLITTGLIGIASLCLIVSAHTMPEPGPGALLGLPGLYEIATILYVILLMPVTGGILAWSGLRCR